ncbi:hypothetical protein NC652_037548 [Populus alba x Populus x berolinensis]|nr:hypothetical protein NC652_037548 [Populus alba x Populus x berolinensis]
MILSFSNPHLVAAAVAPAAVEVAAAEADVAGTAAAAAAAVAAASGNEFGAVETVVQLRNASFKAITKQKIIIKACNKRS